jgi:hypothetical protein
MMNDEMAELAKQAFENFDVYECKDVPNYKKHYETCLKNKKKRKKRRK